MGWCFLFLARTALSIVQSRYREWLFFYKLSRISERKTERTTEAGYWKSTGQDREIRDGGRLIGTKKTLVFYKDRTPHGVKTDWVIHEYRATADYIPPNAENSYVVGFLRNKAAERTETSTSIEGRPSSHLAGSSSQSNSVGVTPMEFNSMDYELAWRTQLADMGIFHNELAPFTGLPDPPSSSIATNNNQNVMEEEGMSLEDLPLPYDFDYEEESEWPLQVDTTEQEIDFMDSMFPNPDHDHLLRPNYRASDCAEGGSITDPEWENEWCDPIVQQMSDGTSRGHSEGFYQKRMETGVRHDEILIMDSSVDSATVTAYEINCPSVLDEKSVTRTCKSQYKTKSHKSVGHGPSKSVQLQAKSSEKAVSRDKARESGVRGPVVQPARDKKSIVQSCKDPKMKRDRNTTKSDLNSRSNGSAGSSRKNSFNSVEMSQLSCKSKPPLVYVGNVLLGVILFIVVVWEVLSLH